ncbi:E3 ubiquitin-protein ligase rnf213-beta [Aplochiton taeniatus]
MEAGQGDSSVQGGNHPRAELSQGVSVGFEQHGTVGHSTEVTTTEDVATKKPRTEQQVFELISERLLKFLHGELKGTAKSQTDKNPLMLGLSVFMVCTNRHIDLGVKGTVVGLMNRCAQSMVPELVLLVPLLHRLRQPGADAARLGPSVEEEGWAGLDGVKFRIFRERIQSISDKRKQSKEDGNTSRQLLDKLEKVQHHFSEWRDGLLNHTLLKQSRSLSYPKEIEMWDALVRAECSLESVSAAWRLRLGQDLRKRISRNGDVDKVMVCCLESSTKAIGTSNDMIQSVFQELCHSAIKSICQAGKEGDLMQKLHSVVKEEVPSTVMSTLVVESAARFEHNNINQLLSSQSVINHILSEGDWKPIQVDDAAGQVVRGCQNTLASLVESLCQGHITLGHLKATLEHKEQFKKLYRQYKKNSKVEGIPTDAEKILTQREGDLRAFREQREHMATLIKMMGKVSEHITVPEMPCLEDQHRADLHSVSLNKLVAIRDCSQGEVSDPGQILWYNTTQKVWDMAREMHQLKCSNLILTSWVRGAEEIAPWGQPGTPPRALSLSEVCDYIWMPQRTHFCQLGLKIAKESASFEELDRALGDSGDEGDGKQMESELNLMAELLRDYKGLELDWVKSRIHAIQEYRQLHHASASASAILKIATRLKLSGDFSEIQSLTQLKDDAFKKRVLGSLTEDLLGTKRQLSMVTQQHTACLDVFLESQALVSWVKDTLKNMSDVKVFVELASISAGENDTEIDRVASFLDAVMGYAPLLFSLSPSDGFKEFMASSKQVWDTLNRDEKLPDKLRDSTRWLSWLKGLKETHGSVEQSSLSLASDINAQGVYCIGWPRTHTAKRSLQSLIMVRVRKQHEEKDYNLEELLELQNKLMLMSSKGEHGKEQVNRFTQVFEGVQRLGTILLQMQSSGNMLFREWQAQVHCSRESQPCIRMTFSLRDEELLCRGEATEQLQALCRSMEACHREWCGFLVEKRSEFHALNHYTAEQMVYLCHWIYKVSQTQVSAPQQLWHLLSPIKPRCTLSEVREALACVTDTPVEEPPPDDHGNEEDEDDYDSDRDFEVEDYTPLMDCTSTILAEPHGSGGEEELVMAVSSDLEEDDEKEGDAVVNVTPAPHDVTGENSDDGVEGLWRRFKDDMPRYLSQHLDIATLARFLSCLSEANPQHVKRKLPPALLEGKPNLVICPSPEIFSTTLSFYTESPEQPLPSTDEVLCCGEETTEEEVEIFLRRALGRGPKGSQQKIYALVNPGLLGYDVSVALGERFEALQRSAGPHYRLVLVSPMLHQHRYVPSFFSNHKVQAGVGMTAELAKRYLRHHFTVPFSQSPVSQVYPDKLSAWVVSSTRPAVGKSLYVDRLHERLRQICRKAELIRIRLIEPRVDLDSFVQSLLNRLAPLREQDAVVLHIDTAAVSSALEEFLFHLLVLGCLSDSRGMLWRRNASHLIAVEVLRPCQGTPNHPRTKETGHELLDILPTIECRPPKEVQKLLLASRGQLKGRTLDPMMDQLEFSSEGIQRPYQFLKRFNNNQNLDSFMYQAGSIEKDPIDCLYYLLANCGMQDPSWAELKNFTWFLNVQLKDCENSAFCDPDFLGNLLPGFKAFIVKFMVLMARDFASPSMDTSDQSPSPVLGDNLEEDLLARLTIRKRWECESHPYIFFNADRFSMSFLGFNVKKSPGGTTLNAVDPRSQKVLMGDVMTPKLMVDLELQNISLTEDFDSLPRADKIKRISLVVGAKKGKVRGAFDPDPTYELTADNVMKMLAIHMRFRCGIPVIIMGETGCGKTRLVRFLCDLQREERQVENMKLVKVHGGTTAEMIYQKVREAETLAEKNRKTHNLETVLFFDEANTTESIFAIKEVLCDRTVQGRPLKMESGLKIIAACNPYRKHSPEMVERLERAGLGYRVKAGETADCLGKVPLRQLVYRVHPLPPSMASLVWDFGQLSDSTELSYIRQIVRRKVEEHHLPVVCDEIISNVLAASQEYMRIQKDECSFVSLRDVERSMKVLVWFYTHGRHLFGNSNDYSSVQRTLKSLALAVGVCYYPSLVSKKKYLSFISRDFPHPLNSADALQDEISSCQNLFLENIHTRETIAKNVALKENVFLMVVCIELRIPLFLVGKPGSSKSLAKTVVADAMQGQNAQCHLFKELKQVHMVSFQCSPHSSPEGIIGTFRNCARFQKDKNMDEYVSVVVLDEIGLAEDSPQMPLKTLHPLLEDGCIDNEKPDPHMKVGFVGISNWALDPAKMNRGIFVSRWDPIETELVNTAEGICASSKPFLLKIKHLFPHLAKAFLKICAATAKNQFFGLRDYYSLVKMLFAAVKSSKQEPSDKQLAEAILRNFSGQPEDFDPVIFFQEISQSLTEIPRPSTLQMVEQNLDRNSSQECRYLLLLTTNNAALHILQQRVFARREHIPPEIVFGSGFPKDQEYAQICRNVNRVKTCMETGRTVILLNLQNLYESLYDALNQYYVYLSGQQYVDLGLGSHRVKCRVHPDFRLVVVEDQKKVYEHFPVPLINRLEKHRVDRGTDLTAWQCNVLGKLKEWTLNFSGGASGDFQLSDIFVGFHGDACASALLQALESREQQMVSGAIGQQREDEEYQGEAEAIAGEEVAMAQGVSDDTVMDTDEEQRRASMDSSEDNAPTETLENANPSAEGLPLASSDTDRVDESRNGDMDEMETENGSEPADMDEEEEVFELAKCFLLNCVTPDSVLRLKHADLGNQEKETLRRTYFQQQRHHSLRDFMEGHLSKPGEASRFVEVTTFSSLLTRFDVRLLAQALGLDTQRFLLLSLHQFDTEVSFCSKLRDFLQDAGPTLHIVCVQMDIEESHCCDELIASAKYCTMNYLMSVTDQTCYVVFITKLSRIPSRSQYIGFQGGAWHSVHIDDLRDSDEMSLNLSVFCGTPISKLLAPALPGNRKAEDTIEHSEEGVDVCRKAEMAQLCSVSLVRSCIQKAVGLLREPNSASSRSMQRMHVLMALLREDHGQTGAHFQEVLLARLARALVQREEMMYSPGDWVTEEAQKRQALQEGGTLRHTLWRCLQSTLTPALAFILEVLDRDANLELLFDAGLSQGLVQLWLDIVSDTQTLDLTIPQSSSVSDHEVVVHQSLKLGEKGHPCAAPFSWLVKVHFQSLWDESEFVPVKGEGSTQRILQFVSTATSSRLGSYIQKLSGQERLEYSHRYLDDFLLLSFKINSENELKVYTKAMLGCVSELQRSLNVTLDVHPAWVLAAARHYAPRLDTLTHILLLQPQLALAILQQSTKRESADMIEDILALGICVEETKLQNFTSAQECEYFVRRVDLLQPCLDRIFSQKYSALCSPASLPHLNSVRSMWRGMLVVTAFIQQNMLQGKQRVAKLKDLALKHCNLLQNLMQDSPDLRSLETLQQLIRILNSYHEECISRDLRYGIHCPVCLSEISQPSVLPCEHVFCLSCLQSSVVQTDRPFCPKCRANLPPNFCPTVSQTVQSALQQHADIRGCCNSFFLEVVSRFCLSEGDSPGEGVVELLFSLLISAQGDVYKTRELTPFLECVDNSPVVRSVLPKLLLQYSFNQVKGHISRYLQNLEENILDRKDRTELYLLFVNCFQDSLHCSIVEEGNQQQRRLQEETRFLSRLARKQTPDRQQDPAEFLLSMARLRLCLATAARLLQKALAPPQRECHGTNTAFGVGDGPRAADTGGCGVVEAGYLEQVKAVFEYCGNDWYRVYCLRALQRQAGIDCVLTLMKRPDWKWVFPPEVLRLQRLIPTEVDRFLCSGPSYRALRDGVAQALLESKTDPLVKELQKLKESKCKSQVFLVLALFRQVTCRLSSPDQSIIQPTPQATKKLEDFLKKVVSGALLDFCTALLSNRIGGPGSPLRLSPKLQAQRRALLGLLVHADSVLLSGNALLLPLHQIAFQPQSMRNCFLPTMADDHTDEARRLMIGTKITGDQTRTGHILGKASRRSDAPERGMNKAQSCVLRLLTHLAMLQGTITCHLAVSDMIQPRNQDVQSFLWSHLEKDMEVLGGALDLNMDHTAILVHLVLNTCISAAFLNVTFPNVCPDPPRARHDLSSRIEREQWEKQVCDVAINPVVQHLRLELWKAQERIGADDNLGGSPLIRLLHSDPRPVLPLPSDCPTAHTSFWSIPETLTVERLSQRVGQAEERSSLPLLDLFLRRVQCVRQLHHLPELAALQSDLLRAFPLAEKTLSIAQMVDRIPAGYQKKTLLTRVKIFMEVWNSLRMEVSINSADLGVEMQLCEEEVSMDSSGEFLTPCRRGPGSCLRILVDFLSGTHNSLVTSARKVSRQEESDYDSVPLEGVAETQLALCHPERELLPLVLAHCHYTLKKGSETDCSYDLLATQTQLAHRFLAGKPLIRADTSRFLNRQQQDFSVVLTEVRAKIPQEPLKGSVSGAMKMILRSYTDVCDAVFVLEIALRFLGKTGGEPQDLLLTYLKESLQMGTQISDNVAKALGECGLEHSTFTWQLLTCWKSELMLNRDQDPFPKLSAEFQQELSDKERKALKAFLSLTDLQTFYLELHEILQLKTSSGSPDEGYSPQWDVRSTLENHLEQKNLQALPGLDSLPEEITLDKGADAWRMAIMCQKR